MNTLISQVFMKRILCVVPVFLMQFSLAAQTEQVPGIDYLKKSRDQKTAAYITLGCGAATLIPGIIILNQAEPDLSSLEQGLKGSALTAVGVGCITASIILFSSSDRNKKRADKISVNNKPISINIGLAKKQLPYSLGISIPIK